MTMTAITPLAKPQGNPKVGPVAAFKAWLHEQGLLQAHLVPYIGSRGRVSAVMCGRRRLTSQMVKALHQGLRVPMAHLTCLQERPVPRAPISRPRVADNLGSGTHRHRIATPLTPRAVRMQMLAPPSHLRRADEEDDGTQTAEQWLEERMRDLGGMLTELDRLLDDEETSVLERFCANEEMLMGNARCPQWTGERVQTSAVSIAPLHDDALPALAGHARAKQALDPGIKLVLLVFVNQQLGMEGAPTAAQAAIQLGLPGKHRRQAWHLAVKAAAVHLVAMRY